MTVPFDEYPRPQMRRDNYTILNGKWQYAITGSAAQPEQYQGEILVPFSPEAPLSGVGRTLRPGEYLHYKRTLPLASKELARSLALGRRLLLHFGAVDEHCRIYVNDRFVSEHRGGYLSFTVDVTDELIVPQGDAADRHGYATSENILHVVVRDDSDTSFHARGKQKLSPGGMFYTAQSGIWQTVWMEWVPASYISGLRITPHLTEELLELTVYDTPADGRLSRFGSHNRADAIARIYEVVPQEERSEEVDAGRKQAGEAAGGAGDDRLIPGESEAADGAGDDKQIPEKSEAAHRNRVSGLPYDERDRVRGSIFSDRHHLAGRREIHRFYLHTGDRVYVRIPNPHPWTPEDPYLYTITVEMGEDLVESYFAMRSFSSGEDARGIKRFCLNGKPYFMNGVLDQGYWPGGLLTPPDDQAMIDDIRRVKALGFNMLRKHVKIEPARWYYHCDRIGMLVWQDAVNGGSSYDMNFVCNMPNIVSTTQTRIRDNKYELFARSDPEGRQEYLQELRQMVEQLYNAVSICTWVPFNEGWGQFDALRAEKIVRSLDQTRLIDHASGWFDQGGGDYRSVHNYFRPLSVRTGARIYALTEYGGYSRIVQGHAKQNGMGAYRKFGSEEEITDAYVKLFRRQIIPGIAKGLSATVYTQLSDIEEEVNGLYTYDREILKINEKTIRRLNRLVEQTFAECT